MTLDKLGAEKEKEIEYLLTMSKRIVETLRSEREKLFIEQQPENEPEFRQLQVEEDSKKPQIQNHKTRNMLPALLALVLLAVFLGALFLLFF